MTKREEIMSKIEIGEKELNEKISHVNDWKESKEMRNILLNQIQMKRLEIGVYKGEVKVIDIYNKCRDKVKSYMNK